MKKVDVQPRLAFLSESETKSDIQSSVDLDYHVNYVIIPLVATADVRYLEEAVALTGCNFVRFTRHGLQAIRHHWARTGDRFEVRRQALKLRFWDERHLHPPGMLFDHSYESIKSLGGLGIYELRLDDAIGGLSNIRVVFFDPPTDWQPTVAEQRPMRIIWVLEALAKKRNNWTANEITRFRTSRLLLRKRCYS